MQASCVGAVCVLYSLGVLFILLYYTRSILYNNNNNNNNNNNTLFDINKYLSI